MSEKEPKKMYCTWHCCQKDCVPSDRYCAEHAKLAAQERKDFLAAQEQVRRGK